MTGLALKQTVETLFDVIKDRSTTEELYFVCPVPGCQDQTGNRSVNLKSGKTNCWRCNQGGDFVKWANFLGFHVTDTGSRQAMPIDDLDLNANRDEEQPLPLISAVKLPDGFTYCHDRPNDLYTDLIAEMAERKHLAIEDLMEARVGFTKEDPRWEPFAIFPVIEDDRVVYYQGRTYVDVPGETTKRFPNRRECPNSSKYWVYNIDALRRGEGEIAMVMESILNVLSMRRFFREEKITNIVPVCIFKHYLSKPQAKKILSIRGLKEVCLLYDHDATRSSLEKSPMISDRIPVTIAAMPCGKGGEKNDPNDDPVAAWEAFQVREISDVSSTLKYSFNLERKPGKPRPQPQRVTKPLDDLVL